DHFGRTFISIAIPVLLIVLYAGIATITRLTALNRADYRWVIGMNRLRNAYLEIHPELAPHFVASPYDDLHGALQTLGIDVDEVTARRLLRSIFHLPQTLPGMLTVIVAAVAGAIAALSALAFAAPSPAIVLSAAAGFLLVMVLAGGDVLERIMSPPAERKSIARVAGGMLATAAVSPRSSEIMTPRKPIVLRSIWVMTTDEKAARWFGSIRVYLASATMTKSAFAAMPWLKEAR